MRVTLDIAAQRRQFGEILIQHSIISEEELKTALSEQRRTRNRQRLGTMLLERGLISAAQFMFALAQQMTVIRRFGQEAAAA